MFTTEETTFTDINFFAKFPSFIFKENQVIIGEDDPLEKNVTGELDGIDTDDIGNVEGLLRIVFIHEECGNLKVFAGDEELTRHINENKKPGTLQTYRCPLCDKYFMREYFCSKYVEYCESVE